MRSKWALLVIATITGCVPKQRPTPYGPARTLGEAGYTERGTTNGFAVAFTATSATPNIEGLAARRAAELCPRGFEIIDRLPIRNDGDLTTVILGVVCRQNDAPVSAAHTDGFYCTSADIMTGFCARTEEECQRYVNDFASVYNLPHCASQNAAVCFTNKTRGTTHCFPTPEACTSGLASLYSRSGDNATNCDAAR
jgi:hypothetical protein